MRIRTILTVVLLGSMLAVAGCSTKSTGSPVNSAPAETGSPAPTAANSEAPVSPSPAIQKESVKVYFANDDGSSLVEKTAEIQYEKPEDKYLNTLKAMTATDDPSLFPLAKGLAYQSVELADGTLTIDLSISDEGRLGSGGEVLLMDALKKAVFQFSEVQALDILVDGKIVDSLMGHVELEHPIKRQ